MEKMLFCHLCKLEFDTAEDISLHTCVEIKQEYVDAKLLDNYDVSQNGKVEKILKDSLDSIPSLSPSEKIGGIVCLRCTGNILLGVVNKVLKNKRFVDITQQCFALLSQINFLVNNLNFH